MGWADRHIAQLQAGRSVAFRPRGNSMAGYVPSGALVVVEPRFGAVVPKQVVLCRVRGQQYLHLVFRVDRDRVQIGNARGHVNGWTPLGSVYGVLVSVDGRGVSRATA